MLELIRTQAMSRIAKRNEDTRKHQSVLTPYADEQVELQEDLAKECKIKPSTMGLYQASLSGCTYSVNLVEKTCTCRKWQIKGIPCEHAQGVILKKNFRTADYVAKWFHTDTWMRTYEEGIKVPRGAKFWPKGAYPPLSYPPNSEKMGCKEKKRKRGKNESPTKKKDPSEKRALHCKICGKAGHNSRFHKKGKDVTSKVTSKKRKVTKESVEHSKGSKQNMKNKEAAKGKNASDKANGKKPSAKAKGNVKRRQKKKVQAKPSQASQVID